MKVAIIHDWLTGMRGGEYVLEAIIEMFPKAELFTLVCVPDKISPLIKSLKIHTSFLQKIPSAEKRYRYLLPLMPYAIESFNLKDFDLIISSSHCVAKGVRKRKDAIHISYIHAPMRYMWDRFQEYFGSGQAKFHVRLAAHLFRPYLQSWDKKVSSREKINALIANSHFISSQIKRIYQRNDIQVIHPFVDIDRFTASRNPGKNYLMVTAFVPYKRVDLAIETFNQLKLPLWIVGSGPEEMRLKKLAGPTIQFLGSLSNSSIAELYSKCKAFIFPGIEDFGITPLEAMAAGAPVVAYAEGGALETVTSKTGIFFSSQTVESLSKAILKIENRKIEFSEKDCRDHAKRFTRHRFQEELYSVIRNEWMNSGKELNLLPKNLIQL